MASSSGLLDTNVVIHAMANDEHTIECAQFLAHVAQGRIRVRVDPLVVHELTYVLPRYLKQMTRQGIGTAISNILLLEGIEGEVDVVTEALRRWVATPGLGFADAYLAALAHRDDCPVYSKNVRELRSQGATVPDPLPGSVTPQE